MRCCLKKQERHEPFLFFIFQISQALSLLQKPRDDRRAGADEKADDAEDDVERQLLPEEKKRENRRKHGLEEKNERCLLCGRFFHRQHVTHEAEARVDRADIDEPRQRREGDPGEQGNVAVDAEVQRG